MLNSLCSVSARNLKGQGRKWNWKRQAFAPSCKWKIAFLKKGRVFSTFKIGRTLRPAKTTI
jgi:hypothetical protein